MHEPVLIKEVIAILKPQMGESLLDATAGYGGHSSEILSITNNYTESVLVDRDKKAIDYLTSKFASHDPKFMRMDFVSAAKKLANEDRQFDLILADLGVSSPHLDIASRGFSFQHDGPLDMRMDQKQELTAETIVNTWPEEKIAEIIKNYGEDPKSRKIAKSIIEGRPFSSTAQLASNIAAAVHTKGSKKHPATKSFQALRIAVNDELRLLEQALPIWLKLLKPGGRMGIISFHSLEDRIVKNFFKEKSGNRYDADLQLVNKNPITATSEELDLNPRSRSAKLRVAAKIKTTERASDAN
jgi:16S rRNA (cytosine1402-N4)-methyltransferase